MKIKICIFILISLCTSFNSKAQDSLSHLPGSASEARKAASQSDIIVNATLIDHGTAVMNGSGAATFRDVKIQVVKTFKGAPNKDLNLTFERFSKENDGEIIPKEGKEYLFFIRIRGSQYVILKMLASSEANTSAVSGLLK